MATKQENKKSSSQDHKSQKNTSSQNSKNNEKEKASSSKDNLNNDSDENENENEQENYSDYGNDDALNEIRDKIHHVIAMARRGVNAAQNIMDAMRKIKSI